MRQMNAIVIEGSRTQLLEPLSKTDRHYSEAWLQDLIQKHPEILPVGEIEPGFGRLIPVAREVACSAGYIDNLFITGEGGIAVVETKLWRNPEARRQVVAQALDYAAALGRMDYTSFERAALGGQLADGKQRPASLYAMISDNGEVLEESAFIDAVSTNLKRGRMLVIAAGDGVRAETEALATLLQSHAGARFTFALVAIELFKAGDQIFAVPRQLAKTVTIERGVVTVLDDRAVIGAPLPDVATIPTSQAPKSRTTLTEDVMMESLALRDPKLPSVLRTFLTKARDIGVEPHWLGALNLKWSGWPDGDVNMGVISKEGSIWTDPTNWKVGAERARPYHEALAKAFGGRVKDVGKGGFLASADGKGWIAIERVLPEHADEWLAAMQAFMDRLKREAAAGE